MKTKNTRGSALLMVLVFTSLMLTIGAGTIAAAEFSAKSTAATIKSEASYYSAEAAAQVAIDEYLSAVANNEIRFEQFYPEVELPENYSDNDPVILQAKADLLDQVVNQFRAAVIADVEALDLNGETVAVSDLVVQDILAADVKHEVVKLVESISEDVQEDSDIVFVNSLRVYLQDPKFKFTVTCGSRVMLIETNARASLDRDSIRVATFSKTITGDDTRTDVIFVESGKVINGAAIPKFTAADNRITYKNQYITSVSAETTALFNAVNTVVNDTATALNSASKCGIVTCNPSRSGTSYSYTSTSTNKVTLEQSNYPYLECVNVSGDLELVGNFSKLKHIKVGGSLKIVGDYSYPALKCIEDKNPTSTTARTYYLAGQFDALKAVYAPNATVQLGYSESSNNSYKMYTFRTTGGINETKAISTQTSVQQLKINCKNLNIYQYAIYSSASTNSRNTKILNALCYASNDLKFEAKFTSGDIFLDALAALLGGWLEKYGITSFSKSVAQERFISNSLFYSAKTATISLQNMRWDTTYAPQFYCKETLVVKRYKDLNEKPAIPGIFASGTLCEVHATDINNSKVAVGCDKFVTQGYFIGGTLLPAQVKDLTANTLFRVPDKITTALLNLQTKLSVTTSTKKTEYEIIEGFEGTFYSEVTGVTFREITGG